MNLDLRSEKPVAPPHLTPDGLRAQALACGRLANQALAEGDHAEVGRLVERARELVMLALEAEAEGARR